MARSSRSRGISEKSRRLSIRHSPLRAVTYTTRLSKPVPISLRAEGVRGRQFWFSNEAFIGEASAGETINWQPPKAGRFVLRVAGL